MKSKGSIFNVKVIASVNIEGDKNEGGEFHEVILQGVTSPVSLRFVNVQGSKGIEGGKTYRLELIDEDLEKAEDQKAKTKGKVPAVPADQSGTGTEVDAAKDSDSANAADSSLQDDSAKGETDPADQNTGNGAEN